MSLVTPILEDAIPSIPRVGPPKEMISVRVEGDTTYVRINSSSLGVIQECMRKSQYLLDERWHSDNESPATIFGGAIHKALEVYYTGNPEDRVLPDYEQMELMSYGHKVKKEETDLCLRATRAFISGAAALNALPETDKRSIQNGVYILYHYFKSFIDDPYVALVDEAGPLVERDFTFRLYSDEYLVIDYFGRIDLVVKHIKSGEVFVTDHKTSSVVGADFYNRLKPNHQYTGYLLGAIETLGIKPAGFLVNCLQVKAKPVTARGTPPNFPRQITTRDADDFEEFRAAVVDAVGAYLSAKSQEIWPLGYVNGCAMYGGCTFLSVCSAPKSLRQNVLKAKFTRNT